MNRLSAQALHDRLEELLQERDELVLKHEREIHILLVSLEEAIKEIERLKHGEPDR